MSETMVPTMSFRWLVPSFAAYGEQPDCRRLQQLHHTSSGDKWIDVKMVEEWEDTSSPRATPQTFKPLALKPADAALATPGEG